MTPEPAMPEPLMAETAVANPFAARGVGSIYANGRPFHHPRSLAHIFAMVGDQVLERALDIACGTGMSTVALLAHAEAVVGVDMSAEMLGAARREPGASYLLGTAERLPFTDGAFDAATCCSGVHWFDQARFFAELARVLRPAGWIGLYDHYFTGEMLDVPEFGAWSHEALTRYPLPPRNPQVGDPRSVTPVGYDLIGDEMFSDDIELTCEQLVDYQLTISNFVAAVERGESRDELRAWALETLRPLFADGTTRTVRFVGSVTCLRVSQQSS